MSRLLNREYWERRTRGTQESEHIPGQWADWSWPPLSRTGWEETALICSVLRKSHVLTKLFPVQARNLQRWEASKPTFLRAFN